MEQSFLKKQKELEELKEDIGNVCQSKNEIQRQSKQRQVKMDRNLQMQMVANERLQHVLEQAKGIKPFNYDNVFRDNNELKNQHSLVKVKFKALTMKEKDADLWWDVVQDIVQKDIRKFCRMYERNEKFYRHKISQMEKVIPFFQYEPQVLT